MGDNIMCATRSWEIEESGTNPQIVDACPGWTKAVPFIFGEGLASTGLSS